MRDDWLHLQSCCVRGYRVTGGNDLYGPGLAPVPVHRLFRTAGDGLRLFSRDAGKRLGLLILPEHPQSAALRAIAPALHPLHQGL